MTLSEAHLLSLDDEKRAPSTRFALTVTDLARLTDPVHPIHPNELGGIDRICQGLCVDPTVGLRSEEENENSSIRTAFVKFASRKKAFGRNVRGAHFLVLTFFSFSYEKGLLFQ